MHDPVERADHVVADVVRRVADEGVEERGAERPHVAGGAGLLARRHLGREVGRRAGDHAGLGEGGVGPGAGDAEVGDLGLAVGGDQDVRRLDVAVDDPAVVGRGERVGDLGDQAGGGVRGERTLLLDDLREVAALDVLHDEPVLVAVDREVEDGHDVGVVEGRRVTRLALGALEVGRGPTGREPDALEGHLAAEDLVVPAPHDAHAAAADLGRQRVASGDHSGGVLPSGARRPAGPAGLRPPCPVRPARRISGGV